jgi:signal transduction histidine kinase
MNAAEVVRAGTRWLRRRMPQRVRTRLALLYAALFLAGGTVLLGLTFGLVSHSLGGQPTPKASSNVPDKAFLFACKSAVQSSGKGKVKVPNPTTAECKKVFEAGAKQAAADQRTKTLHDLHVYSILGLGILTLASAALGWVISGRVLRPVRIITETARRASEQHLGERLDLQGPKDELRELADTFDAMLDRLDAAFTSQRLFVANASHELRTPLTAMRTAIDVSLARPARTAEQLEEMATRVRRSVDGAEEMIEALLVLAHSNQMLVSKEFVDLATAVEDALEHAGPHIDTERLSVTTDLQPAEVVGDRILLERMVANLIDNAMRHNTVGGWVKVRTWVEDGKAAVEVVNSGPLVHEEEVPFLFEPFRRSGGRTGEGVGLGLSIVKAVGDAHGATIAARGEAAGGLSVSVKVPRPGDIDRYS